MYNLEKKVKMLKRIAYDREFKAAKNDHTDLGKSDHFRYLQLRLHYANQVKITEPDEPEDGIIRVIQQAYTQKVSKTVSKLYNSLTQARPHSTDSIRQRWERELNVETTEDECEGKKCTKTKL